MRIAVTLLAATAAEAAAAPGVASGAPMLTLALPESDAALAARLAARFEAARAAAGYAPLPDGVAGGPVGCLLPGPGLPRRARGLALPALALRDVEAEDGLSPRRHPSDAAALALLRSVPALRAAFPRLAPCLGSGAFSAACPGGAPSPLRLVAARRAPTRFAPREWTPERVSLMKRMWHAGAIASEIAEALGDVSKSAVIGKLTRLGLTGHGIVHRNPRRKGGRPTHRRPAGALPAMDSAGAQA